MVWCAWVYVSVCVVADVRAWVCVVVRGLCGSCAWVCVDLGRAWCAWACAFGCAWRMRVGVRDVCTGVRGRAWVCVVCVGCACVLSVGVRGCAWLCRGYAHGCSWCAWICLGVRGSAWLCVGVRG